MADSIHHQVPLTPLESKIASVLLNLYPPPRGHRDLFRDYSNSQIHDTDFWKSIVPYHASHLEFFAGISELADQVKANPQALKHAVLSITHPHLTMPTHTTDNNNDQIRLKFAYADTVYVRTVDTNTLTLDYLDSTIPKLFGPIALYDMLIKYADDSGDFISIDTPDDIREMLGFACAHNISTLTLCISPKKKHQDAVPKFKD